MKIFNYILLMGIVLFIGCSSSTDKIKIKGNGIIVSENRVLTEFHSIDVRGAFKIVVEESDRSKVNVETDENIMPYIDTEIIDQVLFIKYTQKGTYTESKQTTIFVEMPILKYVSSSGANNFNINDIHNENILEIQASGAGNINLSGNVKNVTIDIAGAVNMNAKQLLTKNTTINASGTCMAQLQALELLDISLSGACSVYYIGTPMTLNQETSGMCTIQSIVE